MENIPELKKISSDFFFDKQGVIVKIPLEADYVFRAAFFYDGRNQAVLGRNNKDFYLLKSIAPLIREKIKNAKTLTIMECTENKFITMESDLFNHTLEECCEKTSEALFAEDRKEDVFINSAEVFAYERNVEIISSTGIDSG